MKIKPLYLCAFFAALGGILSGFDTGVISGALLYINNDWNLNEISQGFLVSIVLLGAMAGAILNGKIADLLGRKKLMFLTALIFLIGSILCAFSPNIKILMISRFFIGFAIGIITFLSPLYLSEISPEKMRGALVSMFQAAITLGILFSYLSNAFFARFESWRFMFFVGVIPSLILLFGVLFLPDTPRWYVLSGKIEEAKKTFLKLQPDLNPEAEIEKIKSTVDKKEKLKFNKGLILPLVIGIGGMFVQQWTGINTIIYYAPTILKFAGFNDNLSAIYATIGIGVVNFLMTFAAIFLTDKIGRKPLLYIGLFGMGVCLLVLASVFRFDELFFGFSKYFALLSAIVYIMFFACSLGPVMILLVSEVFPLKYRGVLMSISMASNFIFNFAISISFITMLKKIGEFNTFILFSMISFLSIIFVKYVIPETKGVSLEDLERKFKNDV